MPNAALDPAKTMTMAQTICLLSLSRGAQPAVYPPATRSVLRRSMWIVRRPSTPSDRRAGDQITDAGLAALAESPHLAEAIRRLDARAKLEHRARTRWQGIP